VATRVSRGAAAIEAERFTVHPIPFARGSLSPLAAIASIAALRRVHRDVKPNITHHVALQACVLGMLSPLGPPAASINVVIGLGVRLTSDTGEARVGRALIGVTLRFLINRRDCVALVQNKDDRAALVSLGLAQNRIALIPGSGVDGSRLTPLAEPNGAPTF